MTTLEVLRIACKANGLSCHGSSAVLVKRLLTADVKTKSKTTNAKHKKDCAKLVKRLLTADVKTKSKTTNAKHNKMNKGERMSASYYFHEICDGKISRCKPQIVQEPSGRKRLKEIKIVYGANGFHPRWVLMK